MSALFTSNLELLKEKGADDLAQRLEKHHPSSRLIGQLEDASLNIQQENGELLYHPDILTAASEEIENYITSPVRYFLPVSFEQDRRPDDLPEWDETGRLLSDQFVQKIGIALGDQREFHAPTDAGAYMVSFGLGLGIQISLYLDKYPVRNLIIVEPDLDNLYHSFHSINWSGFYARMESRGGNIRFITEQDGTMAGAEAIHAMRGKDYSLVDGSYVIQHYNSDYMEHALESLKASITILQYGLGFLEDETLMYANGRQNLKDNAWRALPAGNPPAPQPVPAFIVGSGPSLDSAISTLKANRDKAVIFSSGTALSALIQNEIYPDFHSESENSLATPQVLSTLDASKLKKTILIATNTVRPEITSMFKDVIFCTRDSVSPTRIFHKIEEKINLAAANVTCLSSRAAMAFGFQTLICFGTDFGSKKPSQHHSKSSIYNTTNDPFYKRGFNMPKMTIQVPGQRQKIVYTNVLFQYARQFLEKLFLEANGFDIYNTADGARILGTKTLDLKQIKITAPFRTKDEILKSILDRMPESLKGARYNPDIAREFEQGLLTHMDILTHKIQGAQDFETLYTLLQPHMQQGQSDIEHSVGAAIRCTTSGTFIQMLQHLNWLYLRMNKEEWNDFWPEAKAITLEIAQGMTKRINLIVETS